MVIPPVFPDQGPGRTISYEIKGSVKNMQSHVTTEFTTRIYTHITTTRSSEERMMEQANGVRAVLPHFLQQALFFENQLATQTWKPDDAKARAPRGDFQTSPDELAFKPECPMYDLGKATRDSKPAGKLSADDSEELIEMMQSFHVGPLKSTAPDASFLDLMELIESFHVTPVKSKSSKAVITPTTGSKLTRAILKTEDTQTARHGSTVANADNTSRGNGHVPGEVGNKVTADQAGVEANPRTAKDLKTEDTKTTRHGSTVVYTDENSRGNGQVSGGAAQEGTLDQASVEVDNEVASVTPSIDSNSSPPPLPTPATTINEEVPPPSVEPVQNATGVAPEPSRVYSVERNPDDTEMTDTSTPVAVSTELSGDHNRTTDNNEPQEDMEVDETSAQQQDSMDVDEKPAQQDAMDVEDTQQATDLSTTTSTSASEDTADMEAISSSEYNTQTRTSSHSPLYRHNLPPSVNLPSRQGYAAKNKTTSPYDGVATLLVAEFPTLHLRLQNALPLILEQGSSWGVDAVCDQVCNAIRAAPSAQTLATYIEEQLKEAPSLRLVSDKKFGLLKKYAREARDGALPLPKEDVSMLESVQGTEATSPVLPQAVPVSPPGPGTSASVAAPNVDMEDAAEEAPPLLPAASTQLLPSLDPAAPVSSPGTVGASHAADGARRSSTQKETLLGLLGQGMQRLASHRFAGMFMIDLSNESVCEGVWTLLCVRKTWRKFAVGDEGRADTALRKIGDFVRSDSPVSLEGLLYECALAVAKDRVACKNPRNSFRNVDERRMITGELVGVIAKQNLMLIRNMKVPHPLTWDEMVGEVSRLDMEAFQHSISDTTELMYKYHQHLKPSRARWEKAHAVEEYILARNAQQEALDVGIEAGPLPAAGRAQHKISSDPEEQARAKRAKE